DVVVVIVIVIRSHSGLCFWHPPAVQIRRHMIPGNRSWCKGLPQMITAVMVHGVRAWGYPCNGGNIQQAGGCDTLCRPPARMIRYRSRALNADGMTGLKRIPKRLSRS